MGPYCKFCQMRCFVPMPKGTPDYILKAYGSSTIVATCRHGQAFEKQKTGYCYDDIREATERKNNTNSIEQVLRQWEDDQLPCLQTLEVRQLIAEVREAVPVALEQARAEERERLTAGMTFQQYKERYQPYTYAEQQAHEHEDKADHITIEMNDDNGDQVGYCCIFCDWMVDWTWWGHDAIRNTGAASD